MVAIETVFQPGAPIGVFARVVIPEVPALTAKVAIVIVQVPRRVRAAWVIRDLSGAVVILSRTTLERSVGC